MVFCFGNNCERLRLQKCALRLSPALRRPSQLRVLMGLSIFETDRILGLPHGTVKAQLARARAKIARHLRTALAPRSCSPPTHRIVRLAGRRGFIGPTLEY